jgi:long-subunit acyl-CoA synthetase (AMP-forming)
MTAVEKFFERSASSAKGSVAVRHHQFGVWTPVTWAELGVESAALAGGLVSVGVKPGDVVGLAMANHPTWISADMAIQSIGAICLPIDPDLDAETTTQLLEAGKAIGVLCGDQEQFDKVDELQVTGRAGAIRFFAVSDTRGIRSLDNMARGDIDRVMTFAQLKDRSTGSPAVSVSGPSTAVIAYGQPLTHQQILSSGEAAVDQLQLGPKDRLLAQTSFADPVERSLSLMGLLLRGVTLAIGEGGPLTQAELAAVQPSVLHAAPGFLDRTAGQLQSRMGTAKGFRKFALKTGWRPSAPSSIAKRQLVSPLRLFGFAALVSLVVWTVVSADMTDPKRIFGMFVILLSFGLGAILHGAAVVGPLRRQLGMQRVRAVIGQSGSSQSGLGQSGSGQSGSGQSAVPGGAR